ncbi:hypothetical protein [Salinicoccus bachuensis]|uniref:Uncharacterized protein n=1 Tax=Salinicoccus bachuensis TaxID=3136731 RepID=A0ABZ3CF34_9STAP
MSIYNKFRALTISGGKQVPFVGLVVDAIDSERSRVKQENLESTMEYLYEHVEKLKIDMNEESEPESSRLISTILKEVEDEYEDLKQLVYSNLLVNIFLDKSKKRIYSNITYQLQNMNGHDIEDFIKMYSYKEGYKEQFKGMSMKEAMKAVDPKMTDEKLAEIEKVNGVKLNTFEVQGPSSIREEEYNRVTIKKFESIGLLQVPRNVTGFDDPSEMYKPNLTIEADDFYNYCIKEPGRN